MNKNYAISGLNSVAVLVGVFFLCVSAASQSQSSDEMRITEIIGAIERGWETADGAPFREHFLDFDGARYFESGGQNKGLSDLIVNHVEPEGFALDSLDLNFSNIEVHIEGPIAWAVADTKVVAIVKADNRRIHNRGYETFLFRLVDDDWKVIHTHSSSRSVTRQGDGHDH